jgi:hypothetical protein
MDPWEYPHAFDFIHGRLIFVAQSNARGLLQLSYDALAPGGILEFHELYPIPHSPAGDTSLNGSWLDEFFLHTVQAGKSLGNDMLVLPRYTGWMREIGFEAIHLEHRALPISAWARDERYRAIGAMQVENLKAGLRGIYTRMFMHGLGWSADKASDAIDRALADVEDTSIHAYFPV